MIVPASYTDSNLCKSVISSAILGYPAPVLINWNKKYEDDHLLFGGSHLAKIGGVLSYLDSLIDANKKDENDLVMIVDGFDVWYQLRPNVMIERYFEINKAANTQLQQEHGRRSKVEQRVVFSSQKRCYPHDSQHPACFAIPDSTLPMDTYGNETDADVGDPSNPYLRFRPRYLNSGSVIGPLWAVRKVFERASEKMERDKYVGTDQTVFSEIFGEQEFQRHVMKFQSRSILRKIMDFFAKKLNFEYSYILVDPEARGDRVFMELEPKDHMAHEFGIGLDYESKILHSTVFSEDDTEWVIREDRERITNLTMEKGVPLPPRVGSLPQEVTNSLHPFYSSRWGYYRMDRIPVWQTWYQVPLFTNIWTGVSPVAVHHNAHRDDLKSRIKTHWNNTWFQPHVRAMLDQRSLSPTRQVALTYSTGSEKAWYGPIYGSWENEHSGVWTDTDEHIDFDRLCEGVWDEVTRDERGSWEDPRYREPVSESYPSPPEAPPPPVIQPEDYVRAHAPKLQEAGKGGVNLPSLGEDRPIDYVRIRPLEAKEAGKAAVGLPSLKSEIEEDLAPNSALGSVPDTIKDGNGIPLPRDAPP